MPLFGGVSSYTFLLLISVLVRICYSMVVITPCATAYNWTGASFVIKEIGIGLEVRNKLTILSCLPIAAM